MIKIAFFDVDGTLIEMGKKYPSLKTIYALNKLQSNGILLCMATGRCYPFIPHFKGIEFDMLLTFNGSYIKNKNEIIYKNPIKHEDVDKIIYNLKEMNRAIAISNIEKVVANGQDEDLIQYFKFGNETITIDNNFDKICKGDIYQIMCSCKKEEFSEILKGTTNAVITSWWDKAVDIIPANSGKGKAVDEILKYYGFNKADAIAFGDGMNDIEMLEAVGTAIVMGNACDEVKAKADVICKSVKDDGIYYYCLDNKLINKI